MLLSDAASVFAEHAVDNVMKAADVHMLLKKLGLDLDVDYASSVLKKYDSDDNGMLDQAEFASLLGDLMYAESLAAMPSDIDPLVLKAFRTHDADGSGSIGASELHTLLKELKLDVDLEYAASVLQQYDSDANGNLSLAELNSLYQDLMYANGPNVKATAEVSPEVLTAFRKHDTTSSGDVSSAEVYKLLRELGVDQDATHAAKMLKAYDTDANGTLSLAEFNRLFKDLMAGEMAVATSDVPEPILAAFRKHDADASGFIDAKELEAALEDTGVSMEPSKRDAMLESFADGASKLDLRQFARLIMELSY